MITRMHFTVVVAACLLLFAGVGCQSGDLAVLPVKYVPEDIDTVMLDADGTRIKVCTWRDYRRLCAALLDTFGMPLPANPGNAYGSYSIHYFRWPVSGRFGIKEGILDCMVSRDMDEYFFIQMYWVNEQRAWQPLTPGLEAFFRALCRQNLFNQPVIMRPAHKTLPEFKYLSAVIEYDSLGLCAALDSFSFPSAGSCEMRFTINRNGRVDAADIRAAPEVENYLREWVNTLRFPQVVYNTSGDTTAYTVQWQCNLVPRNFHRRMMRHLQSIPIDEDPDPHAAGFKSVFRHTGDTVAVIAEWDFSRIWFYKIRGADFIPATPAPLTNDLVSAIRLEDMDGDLVPEMVLYSDPNMNGNSAHYIYRWNLAANHLEQVGYLFGGVEKHPERQEIWEERTGSWYMPRVKTVYGWKNGKLIPKRRMQCEPVEQNMTNDEVIVRFLTNPFFERGLDTLVLRSTYKERESAALYGRAWDEFFK
jgi:hypothetical protein